jgi:hypothetical protein
MPKLPAERNITDQDIENYTSMIFDEKELPRRDGGVQDGMGRKY